MPTCCVIVACVYVHTAMHTRFYCVDAVSFAVVCRGVNATSGWFALPSIGGCQSRSCLYTTRLEFTFGDGDDDGSFVCAGVGGGGGGGGGGGAGGGGGRMRRGMGSCWGHKETFPPPPTTLTLACPGCTAVDLR